MEQRGVGGRFFKVARLFQMKKKKKKIEKMSWSRRVN